MTQALATPPVRMTKSNKTKPLTQAQVIEQGMVHRLNFTNHYNPSYAEAGFSHHPVELEFNEYETNPTNQKLKDITCHKLARILSEDLKVKDGDTAICILPGFSHVGALIIKLLEGITSNDVWLADYKQDKAGKYYLTGHCRNLTDVKHIGRKYRFHALPTELRPTVITL